ncbi:hypothetical protein SAMN05216553_105483 [Lentzea fradiae]|uniref:Uncharacterized protein n=1 Tax=Lentzea fradiae TaxID=200378 RepID=A0A1G7RQC9_9PSEU|nr:hypothetical protein SAMN05216553_105483 [Lentzea fradiae]
MRRSRTRACAIAAPARTQARTAHAHASRTPAHAHASRIPGRAHVVHPHAGWMPDGVHVCAGPMSDRAHVVHVREPLTAVTNPARVVRAEAGEPEVVEYSA